MDSFKWSLFFVCLCFKVTRTEASSWTIKVPSSVKGLLGSCVVIPCSYNYPDPGKEVTELTGMWMEASHQLIYHPDKSKMMQQYQNRTELLGDIRHKSCSLKIDPLQQSDNGPFSFRIEIADFDKFSYKEKTVSIAMTSEPNPIRFSVKEEVEEGQAVSASCSVSHSCPTSPPDFTWNHPGDAHTQSQQLDDSGQWTATSTLNFHSTSADDDRPLQCTVTYRRGQHHKTSMILRVKHAPVNVKVEHKSDVKEGEAVRLRCSSDAHPPASSYQWFNETGAQLHQGNVYMLPNVSRHTGTLYCTAINAMGRGKSNPVRLNVSYAPEIKTVSCTAEADVVKCVCIAESRPPSTVHFALSDGVPLSTKVEKHGTVSIGTLQAEFGSYQVVYCLANNTVGKANLTLSLPAKSKMQNLYIAIAAAGGGLVMLLITVGVAKRCRRRSEDAPTTHMSSVKADKDVALPQYTATKRKEKSYDDVHCSEMFANDHVYGNMETDWDEAIYANM